MQYMAVSCNLLQCVAMRRNVWQCVLSHAAISISRRHTSTRLSAPERAHCLCSNTLQHTATHCNTPEHTKKHCNTLYKGLSAAERTQCLFSNMLQHTATRCNTLQHSATRCNTLQHAVHRSECSGESAMFGLPQPSGARGNTSRCNALQHTATRCNTLQHTVTNCNTLVVWVPLALGSKR